MSARTPTPLLTLTTALALVLGGCSGGAKPRDVAPEGEARTISLSVDATFDELELPEDSRPGLGKPPDRIPLRDWSAGSDEHGKAQSAVLPIRTRNLYFFKPSPGMKMLRKVGDGFEEVPHKYFSNNAPLFWSYDEGHVRIHGWDGVPSDDDLYLEYALATTREAELNLAWSDKTKDAFVRSTAQAGPESRAGLLMPAPSRAAWKIEVPPAAELRFASALIRPEVADGPPSDGAEIVVSFEVDGARQEVWSGKVNNERFDDHTIDMSAFAKKSGRLVIETRAGPEGDARFDYVFLADPVIASRKAHPRRVFMVFVDTLRVDHVGAFGYDRDTTPALDRLAAAGAKFATARNVAPWTLPSTRSVLTGTDPEFYFTSPTLQGTLRANGFATAMFAGNLYLSSNFGLNRDWGMHYVELLPRAKPQLDRALEWLEANEGRDLMLLVHLMDAHLPYKEPEEYRRKFAGDPPEALKRDEFHRDHLLAAHLKTKEDRQYVRDRYDNNVRYTDDQLARLYEHVTPDDIVVFFSDHGEEFWDHGGLEHGHTLFDELLRVPLIIRGPGMATAMVSEPVSLLDVAPTVLDMLGLEATGLKGKSLVALASGDAEARAAFLDRPQAFGRPLYGGERWGVLDESRKYITFNGSESVYDLSADENERKDLRDADPSLVGPMRQALTEALDREVVEAWRIAARGARKSPDQPLIAKVKVPGGIRKAWVGEDPTESSAATVEVSADGNVATITWPRGLRGSRDVWVVPNGPIAETTPRLVIDATCGDATAHIVPAPDAQTAPSGQRGLAMSGAVGDRTLDVGFGIMPIPDPRGQQTSGNNAEVQDQLIAMGYAVGNEPKPKEPSEKKPAEAKDEKKPAKE